MRRFLTIVILSVTFQCCQKQEVVVEQQADFYVNSKYENLAHSMVVSEGCDFLYVSSIDFENSLQTFSLDISFLKSGKIAKVKLINKDRKSYETQLFDPSKYISVNNFVYDTNSNEISFELIGRIFEPRSTNSIDIEGRFKNLKVLPKPCIQVSSSLKGRIFNTVGNQLLETLYSSASIDKGSYYHYFYLTNNSRIVFQSNSKFKDFPVGSYKISSDSSSSIKITFEEYIGMLNIYNFGLYRNEEWKEFTIDGSINITEQSKLNNSTYTIGTINFKASVKDENLDYEFKDSSFRLRNL